MCANAALEDQGCEALTEQRAAAEAEQHERSGSYPARVAPDGRADREANDDEVDDQHWSSSRLRVSTRHRKSSMGGASGVDLERIAAPSPQARWA